MSIATEISRLQTAKSNLKTSINAKGGTLTTEMLDDYYLAVDGLALGTPTDATAVASDLLSGKTAYSGNPAAKITGTMTNRGEVDSDITTKTQVVTIASGYHNGSGTVQISSAEQAKLLASNIKQGVTILGIAGEVRAIPLLAGGLYIDAFGPSGPDLITYSWSTQFAEWNGKTILVSWATDLVGTATFKLFDQTLTANSSGILVGKVMLSTAILLSGGTSNSATTTQISFSSLESSERAELVFNVYEVV